MVAIFTELGPDDPLARDYRRRLAVGAELRRQPPRRRARAAFALRCRRRPKQHEHAEHDHDEHEAEEDRAARADAAERQRDQLSEAEADRQQQRSRATSTRRIAPDARQHARARRRGQQAHQPQHEQLADGGRLLARASPSASFRSSGRRSASASDAFIIWRSAGRSCGCAAGQGLVEVARGRPWRRSARRRGRRGSRLRRRAVLRLALELLVGARLELLDSAERADLLLHLHLSLLCHAEAVSQTTRVFQPLSGGYPICGGAVAERPSEPLLVRNKRVRAPASRDGSCTPAGAPERKPL